jgi:prepilin-type N-terminal cleavage/methylation domain-containing protein
MKKQNGKKGFTLIEVMVSLFLSVLVAFFVYTMMISSYTAYKRLASISQNANSLRFFTDVISKSIKYCDSVYFDSVNKRLCFEVFDVTRDEKVKEEYYFSTGTGLVEHEVKSKKDNNTVNSTTLGVFKKDIRRISDNHLYNTIAVSNIIRTIYFYINNPPANSRFFKTLTLSVIYDDVVGGNVSRDEGATQGVIQASADGLTEMDSDTINQRMMVFNVRG